jgi:vacuolar-type H+-ATPase catalytic subunit A/Vma1
MGRKAPIIELSAGQEEELKRRIRRPTGEQRVAERARIILAAGTGKTNKELARQLGLNRDTVSLWRQRWAQARERLARAEERSLAALSRYIGISWWTRLVRVAGGTSVRSRSYRSSPSPVKIRKRRRIVRSVIGPPGRWPQRR